MDLEPVGCPPGRSGAEVFVVSGEGATHRVADVEEATLVGRFGSGAPGGDDLGDIEFGRTLEDDQEVTLDSGESQDVVLSWDTGQTDPGTYDATVRSESDSDIAAINVQEAAPANFDVSIDSTNSPVVEGERVGVTATVENTGDLLANQTITLRTGEETLDSRPVALDGGQTATITLNWETEPGDGGEYSVNVASDDEIDFAEVTVLEAGNLDVSIDRTSSPAVAGEPLSVTATVANTGNAEISGPVELRIGGQTVDTADLTLPPAGSQSVTFEWATQPGDAGEHRATVASSSNTDSVIVTVQEPAQLAFEETSTNSPVVEGEELEVTTTVANTGGVSADQPVELRINDETVDSSDVSLIGGEDRAVTLVWQTEAGDAGEYVATVAGDGVSRSADVTVLRGARFEVNITSTNSPVSGGESVEVTATVTNTGDVSGSQSVTLTADGVERDSQELTLESGESREITVSWATAEVEPGEYDVEVASRSDSETTVATLEESSDDSVPTTIWLLILLVLLILAAIYYYIRRRQLSERQSNAGQPSDAGGSDGSSGGSGQPGEKP